MSAGADVKEVSTWAGYSSFAFTLERSGHLYDDASSLLGYTHCFNPVASRSARSIFPAELITYYAERGPLQLPDSTNRVYSLVSLDLGQHVQLVLRRPRPAGTSPSGRIIIRHGHHHALPPLNDDGLSARQRRSDR